MGEESSFVKNNPHVRVGGVSRSHSFYLRHVCACVVTRNVFNVTVVICANSKDLAIV